MKSVKSPSGDQGIPGWNTEHEKKNHCLKMYWTTSLERVWEIVNLSNFGNKCDL